MPACRPIPIVMKFGMEIHAECHAYRPELSHGVMQQSRRSESAEKHVCNERTSSNMCTNFHLKRFHISRDTSEIVLHDIKQCLLCKQFVNNVVGCTQSTPERHSNSYQSTDEHKMC